MVIRDDYDLRTASTLLGSLVTDQRREDLHTEHTKRKPEYEERTYTRYEWYDTVDCLPGFRLASSRQCACKSDGKRSVVPSARSLRRRQVGASRCSRAATAAEPR